MPTRKSTPANIPLPLRLVVSRDEARARLEDRIAKGRDLKLIQISTAEILEIARNQFRKWDAFNSELLKQIFSNTELFVEYSQYSGIPLMVIGGHYPSLGEKIAEFNKDIDRKINRLDSISERLELIPLKNEHNSIAAPIYETSHGQVRSKKVFVVHGRDDVSKTNLEVFLHEIGLEPVVLHRQADEGLTIIEKFEKYSDVGYAFILLTPDEISYLAADEHHPDSERVKEFRARPNVIFEFGYFVAKLGRSRVCCLYTGNVTLPSDVSGMIYKRFNDSIEEAAYSITKDLKAAGYAL